MKLKTCIFSLAILGAIAMINFRLATHSTVVQASATHNTMSEGVVGASYSQAIRQNGGVGPYTWTLAKGSSLPEGLSLDASSGIVSGTPAAAGVSEVMYTVSDSSNPALTATQTYRLKIAPEPLTFESTLLQSGIAGRPTSQALVAHGGTPPYNWSVADGALPDGMTLNASTGIISGRPISAKTTAFTIRVKDSAARSETGWNSLKAWTARSINPEQMAELESGSVAR